MLSETQIDLIRKTLLKTGASVELMLHGAATNPDLSQRLAITARLIEEATNGAARITTSGDENLPARPALVLAGHNRRNIRYLAVPAGPEAGPFTEALVGLMSDNAEPELAATLKALDCDAELLVFIAPDCPHCPLAVRQALRLALANPLVRVTVIDSSEFPELAERYSVSSVPLTVLGDLSLIGAVRAEELADHVLSRGSEQYATRAFLSLLETERMDDAVERLLEGALAPFVNAWLESTTATRMGLLVAAEEALLRNAAALDAAANDLLPALRSKDASLRGDTADLIGRIGLMRTEDALRELLDDPIADVAEIAQEMLEELNRD